MDYLDLEFDEEKYCLGTLCKQGHDWNNTGASLRYHPCSSENVGSCVSCGYLKRIGVRFRKTKREFTIEAKAIAEERNGECLSEYTKSVDKLLWRCNTCGHEWRQVLHYVRRGGWCPNCAGQVFHFDLLLDLLAHKGIKCLSNYNGAGSRIDCKCEKCGHDWSPITTSLWRHGCPACAARDKGKLKRLSTDTIRRRLETLNNKLVEVKWYTAGNDRGAKVVRECVCGRHIKSTLGAMRLLKDGRCYDCVGEVRGGENHYHWKPQIEKVKGLTPSQYYKRHYKKINPNYEKEKYQKYKYWKEVMWYLRRKMDVPDIVRVMAMEIVDKRIALSIKLLDAKRNKDWEEYVMALQDYVEISEEATIALLQGTNTRPQFVVKSAIRQAEVHVKTLEQQTNRVVINAFNHPDQAVPLLDT